jgi:hypothetical protein
MDFEIADAVLGHVRPPFRRGHCEKYTASLDAAMTLVPEGCLFTVRTVWDGDETAGLASVSRYTPAKPCRHPRRYWMDEHQTTAATPALALTAAALRARASLKDQSGG